MAKPQLEDGHIALATELFGALYVAHFDRNKRIVLAPLLLAMYGPDKKPSAFLDLIEIGRRLEADPRPLRTALRELIAQRVVIELPGGDLKLNKDWEAWTVHRKEAPADPLVRPGEVRLIAWIKARFCSHEPPPKLPKPGRNTSPKATPKGSYSSPSTPPTGSYTSPTPPPMGSYSSPVIDVDDQISAIRPKLKQYLAFNEDFADDGMAQRVETFLREWFGKKATPETIVESFKETSDNNVQARGFLSYASKILKSKADAARQLRSGIRADPGFPEVAPPKPPEYFNPDDPQNWR